jgi:2-keto-4-pentenoate hydratase/2-oxohepta-3-ene-1,7-dioic acid hydratase in catechol pathway
MKLVSFERDCPVATHQRVGVLRDDGTVVDVTAAHRALLNDAGRGAADAIAAATTPSSMLDFLRAGEQALEAAEAAVDAVEERDISSDGSRVVYDRSKIRLLSPLPRPNSIKDCTVYERHLLNCRDIEPGSLPDAYYEYPVYYKGNPDAVVHPGETVSWPGYTDELDFELEIAAVIGKRGRDVPAARADEHIAGFTIFNDFSARDVQREAKPVKMGPSKSKDFANGFGPCIVTTDAIDPTDLETTVRVDGEVWSTNTTDGMYHSWGDIVEHVSEGITIHPGDVIGSGTVPLGCGLELDRWLRPGDTIELDVEGIGTLEHRIGSKG